VSRRGRFKRMRVAETTHRAIRCLA
jgi:hypothetical protein